MSQTESRVHYQHLVPEGYTVCLSRHYPEAIELQETSAQTPAAVFNDPKFFGRQFSNIVDLADLTTTKTIPEEWYGKTIIFPGALPEREGGGHTLVPYVEIRPNGHHNCGTMGFSQSFLDFGRADIRIALVAEG